MKPASYWRRRAWRNLGFLLSIGLMLSMALTGHLAYQMTATNLLANGNFESSLSGWNGWNANLSRVTGGHTGTYAARATHNDTTSSFTIGNTSPFSVASTTKGVTYTGSGFLRSAYSKHRLCLVLREQTTGGTIIAGAQKCLYSTSSWQGISGVNYTAANSGDELEVYAADSDSTKGHYFDLDTVVLTSNATTATPTPTATPTATATPAATPTPTPTATATATATPTPTPTTLSFESVTSWARPAPNTPSAASSAGWRLVPFTTKTSLDAAISTMQGHDYIYYAGTGVLSITTGSAANVYTIANRNPSLPVVIDFGASHDLWDSSRVSSNYVQFSNTGTNKGWDCFFLNNDSNLRIFGGDLGPNLYGGGIRVMGNTHDLMWWDSYVHNVGGSGIGLQPINSSTGASMTITHLNIRSEVTRFAMNPSLDPHADKGTGEHAVIIHGADGIFDNNTVTVYAHDSLKPGEVSVGQTWPEGGGGSALEPGTDSVSGQPTSQNNDTYYVKGVNLLMIANGTNPGSTASQTGGNIINAWGSVPMNGNVYGWIEGDNITGAVFHGAGGGWYKASPAILVQHGRHYKTNLSTVGQSQNVPYYQGFGIVYQDCQ